MSTKKYDFYKCEVCGKVKKAGDEDTVSIAYSRISNRSQDGEAKLAVHFVLACDSCRNGEKT